MKKLTLTITALVLLAALAFRLAPIAHAQRDVETQRAIVAAMASLDDYMNAFNARDPKAWAATLNYPHVRIASESVRVWETEADFAGYMDFNAFAQRFGWDRSAWDTREVVQAGPDKVHIAVTFSRYNAANEKIATFDSLYIMTKQDGAWGTQARSSFAP